jgi:hypothetical protein
MQCIVECQGMARCAESGKQDGQRHTHSRMKRGGGKHENLSSDEQDKAPRERDVA